MWRMAIVIQLTTHTRLLPTAEPNESQIRKLEKDMEV
jgi:hypothetical protein